MASIENFGKGVGTLLLCAGTLMAGCGGGGGGSPGAAAGGGAVAGGNAGGGTATAVPSPAPTPTSPPPPVVTPSPPPPPVVTVPPPPPVVPSSASRVLQRRNDAAGTGAILTETTLSTASVRPGNFGKLWAYAVDGQVYAQPLYVPAVAVSGKGTHNLILVATMNDTLYAFDADSNAGAAQGLLWSRRLLDVAAGATPIPIDDLVSPNFGDVMGTVGVMGTPVIDPVSMTAYVVARSKQGGNYLQRLHAIDLATGSDRSGSPVTIAAPAASGRPAFDPRIHNQRAALALAGGQVIIAWASHQDADAYHGWVMAYDAASLQQTGAYCTTPSGAQGGIWQAGRGPAVDADGNVYFFTGNGSYDGSSNVGESLIKLGTGAGLALQDWFTPDDYQFLNDNDLDLGGSGPLMIPGTRLIAGGGKDGMFYVVSIDNLGHAQANNPQIVQSFRMTNGEIMGGPAYWDRPAGAGGGLMYYWADDDVLRSFAFDGAKFNPVPVSKASIASGSTPDAALSLSANGASAGSGIVWSSSGISGDGGHALVPGILRAFDAADLGSELWNSELAPARDSLGTLAKFTPPTIAAGRVYMATFSGQVAVYGLLPQ